jgi:uncharacterized protein YcbX
MPDRMGSVTQRWRYPVKSFRGERLEVTETVERSVMTTFHQEDLLSAGLLRFLGQRNQMMLGVYASVASPGAIRLGDEVYVKR